MTFIGIRTLNPLQKKVNPVPTEDRTRFQAESKVKAEQTRAAGVWPVQVKVHLPCERMLIWILSECLEGVQ